MSSQSRLLVSKASATASSRSPRPSTRLARPHRRLSLHSPSLLRRRRCRLDRKSRAGPSSKARRARTTGCGSRLSRRSRCRRGRAGSGSCWDVTRSRGTRRHGWARAERGNRKAGFISCNSRCGTPLAYAYAIPYNMSSRPTGRTEQQGKRLGERCEEREESGRVGRRFQPLTCLLRPRRFFNLRVHDLSVRKRKSKSRGEGRKRTAEASSRSSAQKTKSECQRGLSGLAEQ